MLLYIYIYAYIPHIFTSQTYNRLGKHEKAIEDCDTAIRVSAWDSPSHTPTSPSHCGAVSFPYIYTTFLQFEPKTLRAYVHKGSALLALGRREEARACYSEALRLFPSEADAIQGPLRAKQQSTDIILVMLLADRAFFFPPPTLQAIWTR